MAHHKAWDIFGGAIGGGWVGYLIGGHGPSADLPTTIGMGVAIGAFLGVLLAAVRTNGRSDSKPASPEEARRSEPEETPAAPRRYRGTVEDPDAPLPRPEGGLDALVRRASGGWSVLAASTLASGRLAWVEDATYPDRADAEEAAGKPIPPPVEPEIWVQGAGEVPAAPAAPTSPEARQPSPAVKLYQGRRERGVARRAVEPDQGGPWAAIIVVIVILGALVGVAVYAGMHQAHAGADRTNLSQGVSQPSGEERIAKETPEILGRLNGVWFGTLIDQRSMPPDTDQGSITVDAATRRIELRFQSGDMGFEVQAALWANGRAMMNLGGNVLAVWDSVPAAGQGGSPVSQFQIAFQGNDGVIRDFRGRVALVRR